VASRPLVEPRPGGGAGPTEQFVRSLPGGKIPDRTDFARYATEERFEIWWEVVRRAEALAEELAELIGGSDPLAGVQTFGERR